MLKDVTCSYIQMLPRMWVGCYSMSLSVYSSDPMWLHLLEFWRMLLSASRAGSPLSNGPKNCGVDISFGRDPWWWAFGAERACRSPLWVQQDLSTQIELTTQMRVAPFRVALGSSLMIAVLLPSCDIILGLKNWFLWPPLFLVLLVILLPCWFT